MIFVSSMNEMRDMEVTISIGNINMCCGILVWTLDSCLCGPNSIPLIAWHFVLHQDTLSSFIAALYPLV